MSVHRIEKINNTIQLSNGVTPKTIGIACDTTSAEAKLKYVQDITQATSNPTRIRVLFDSHLGQAVDSNVATSVGAASVGYNNAGVGNAADTTDDTLFTYSLPANALSGNGKAVRIFAWGKTGATANNKTIKLFFGSTTLLTTGVITTNAKTWYINAVVVRYGSKTQLAFATMVNDTVVTAPTNSLSMSEDDTAAIVIKVTGASGTTGAANDVVGYGLIVDFNN